MTKTEHYQLNQWDASDYVRREDFNEDNRKIDAALEDKSRIATGTYVGNGTYDLSNKTTLTLEFVPAFIIISGGEAWNSTRIILVQGEDYASVVRKDDTHESIRVLWDGNAVSWYSIYK